MAAQTPGTTTDRSSQPLYRVTIVSRTTKAFNYGFLSIPTKIDFAPTPVLTGAKGEATIEPKRGSTLISAHFSNVPPPTRFGPQYLTYVVWAISPEGRAQNLGELSLDGGNKGKLSTSTPLQSFALIVTAEPYYSVTQPSDVVVMENVKAPETVGKVEEVNATFELLPRKDFTFDTAAAQTRPGGKPVSRAEYDVILAVYQAQNAVQLAEAQGADKYAPERIAKARQLLNQARTYPQNQKQEIVSMAREAVQVAEDSRAISIKRAEADKVASEQIRATQVQHEEERQRLLAQTQSVAEQRDAAQARLEAQARAEDRAKLNAQSVQQPRAEADRQVTAAPPAPSRDAVAVDPQQFRKFDPNSTENRRRLMATLSNGFDTIDTPRGVQVTIEIPASSDALVGRMRAFAAALQPFRELHIEVGAHSAGPDSGRTGREAEMVRDAMIAAGIPANTILARGYGDTRPREAKGSSNGGRNQRIEIVVAGDAIGSVPTWDRPYTLRPR